MTPHKPQLIETNVQTSFAPMMKVRNSEYLRIIYGYDYLQKDKYSELLKNKRIGSKIKRSIFEAKLMQKLLEIPLADINVDNIDAQKLLYQFLCEPERQIDPRL